MEIGQLGDSLTSYELRVGGIVGIVGGVRFRLLNSIKNILL